jgi:hypothetical protein
MNTSDIGQLENLTRMTDQIPRVIDARSHAVLDYATAAGFLALGAYMQPRNSLAAALAFINGAAVLGLSLLTDYPGGLWRVISFKTHGIVDAVQAGLSGTGPRLFGFENAPEAKLFYGQAALEAGVIAATDWSSGGDGQNGWSSEGQSRSYASEVTAFSELESTR